MTLFAKSGLFLVRLWQEEVGGGQEWRGRLLHVTTGKAHSFHDMPELVDLLTSVLAEPTGHSGGEPDIPATASNQTNQVMEDDDDKKT